MAPRSTSLRRKVPLYIGLGLALVSAAWTFAAYDTVRATATSLGEERVQAVAAEFSSAFQARLVTTLRSMRTASSSKVITDYFRTGTVSDSLRQLFKRASMGANHSAALFALDGTPLASSDDMDRRTPSERHEELAAAFAALANGPARATVAPLRIMADSVFMPIVGAVMIDSQPAGYLVVWERVSSTAQGRQQLAGIVGADARFYMGNTRGDLWADLGGLAHAFPTPLPLGKGVARYVRDDSVHVLASARAIDSTPLAFAVEFNQAGVMAPADRFLQRSILASAIVVLIATLTAWLLSRRLTTPLHELTQAAEAVAGGDYSQRVPINRNDELGRLATSFNTMAAHVGESQHTLERKVEERTAQLAERNEELEAYAHSISHDLRAPLRAMHGFSQALLEDSAERLDEAGKDYARRIAAAAQRMDRLTQDLLAYSRVSRSEIAVAEVDLGGAVRNAIAQLEADITACGARVTVHDPLLAALGHRPSIEQSVANLVANGLKFVPKGRAPEIDIRAERRNGAVRLWVEDNGIGIDPAHHERIFSVFERLHGVTEFAGTGIGLAIVRKSLERMGGRAGVESALGRGSRFWLELHAPEAA